jgi:hypothetical protein
VRRGIGSQDRQPALNLDACSGLCRCAKLMRSDRAAGESARGGTGRLLVLRHVRSHFSEQVVA